MEKLDKCLTNSGGLYSAINNCTTVKQVLDNAAAWQRMVKNNLIVYCIEQSDDFMKTLVDYPDRLYELVSNEYMQTLMKRSSRNLKLGYKSYSGDRILNGAFIFTEVKKKDGSGPSYDDRTFNIEKGSTYSDGTSLRGDIELTGRSYKGNIFNLYLEGKKLFTTIKYDMGVDYNACEAYVYDLTKPTI